jgi:pimeloyl-ACP methyl ester carboxylesterase
MNNYWKTIAFPRMNRARFRACFALVFASAPLIACTSLPLDRRVAVDNRSLAYRADGNGAPAVVFQSGFGDGAKAWSRIYGKVSEVTTALAYDRVGYGKSGEAGTARDPCTIAREQRDLLHISGVAPPYLLVGHSLGGLYQYVYAKMFPEEVGGLILLDPTHPDHWQHMQTDAPGLARTIRTMRVLFSTTMKREFDDQTVCLDKIDRAQPLRMPVRLLVRTDFQMLERGNFEQMVKRLQSDWLALTGAPRIEEVAGTGHYIQKDRPGAVIDAIREEIQKIRRDGSDAPN